MEPGQKDPLFAADGSTIPSSIKVGDKEYTAEEIQELEDDRKNLARGLTVKSEELKSLKTKVDEVKFGDRPASDLNDDEVEDLKYLNDKLHFMTKDQVSEMLSQRESEIEKRVEERLSNDKKQSEVLSRIDQLSEKYSFIKKEEFTAFIKDNAERFGKLTVDEIANIKYATQFGAQGIKPDDLPSVEPSNAGRPEPKAKIMKLGSNEMNSFLRETMSNKVE